MDAQFAEVLFAVCCFVQKWKLHRADFRNDNPNVLNSKQISEGMIKMMNRGKMEPGYCVLTLVISQTEMFNFSHKVAHLALLANLTPKWHHLSYCQGLASCIGWHLHQPESHQLSLITMTERRTDMQTYT